MWWLIWKMKISTKQQAYAIDCIVQYVDDLIGTYPLKRWFQKSTMNVIHFMA
jgi:hypothetical protein